MSRGQDGTPSSLSRRPGWISLWAGRFDSLEALEIHIDSSEFEKQQGFAIAPPLLPFNAFLEQGPPGALVGLLLKDDEVAEKVVEAVGDQPTNALLLHEDVAFDASLAPRGRKKMRFLGSWSRSKLR